MFVFQSLISELLIRSLRKASPVMVVTFYWGFSSLGLFWGVEDITLLVQAKLMSETCTV